MLSAAAGRARVDNARRWGKCESPSAGADTGGGEFALDPRLSAPVAEDRYPLVPSQGGIGGRSRALEEDAAIVFRPRSLDAAEPDRKGDWRPSYDEGTGDAADPRLSGIRPCPFPTSTTSSSSCGKSTDGLPVRRGALTLVRMLDPAAGLYVFCRLGTGLDSAPGRKSSYTSSSYS